MEKKELLRLWKSSSFPGAFSNFRYFYKGLKQKGIITSDTTESKVKKLLETDLTYQANSGIKRRFIRRKDIAYGLDDRWEADLGDFGKNRQPRYFLLVINVFSKLVYARSVAFKTGESVLAAFKSIISRDLKPPYSTPAVLETDAGREFTNSSVKNYFQHKRVYLSVSKAANKARTAERAVRSFKGVFTRLADNFPKLSTQELVKRAAAVMNKRFHRAIGMSPDEAASKWKEIRDRNYRTAPPPPFLSFLKDQKRLQIPGTRVNDSGKIFALGDSVIIPYPRPRVRKESVRPFSYRVYTVSRIWTNGRPFMYSLKDGEGRLASRRYYSAELRKVTLPSSFPISAVRRKKIIGGKRMALVHWLDYPDSYDSWVDVKDIRPAKH